MQTIQDVINQIFSGIDISPEDKGSFMDVYYISIYKMLIELLTAIRGDQVEFHKAFNEFVSSTCATFSPEEKTDFDRIMQQQQKKLLHDLLVQTRQELPDDMQAKLTENMNKVGLSL